MYITKAKIENVKIIADFQLDLTKDEAPGWHVILGDNGSGKSTFIRTLSLALVGRENAAALRLDWPSWIEMEENSGSISLSILADQELDVWSGSGNTSAHLIKPKVSFSRDEQSGTSLPDFNGNYSKRTIWGTQTGWYSAAFGPFRRFRGGDNEYDKLYHSHPRLAAHLSAFGEDVALSEALEWVKNKKFRALENDANAEKLVDGIMRFVNTSELLPHGALIDDISSKGIFVNNGANVLVEIEELSDGYRSTLAMTFDILRSMEAAYGEYELVKELANDEDAITLPGVILIDEIDAHLHPAWQKRIGHWFTKCFPKVQFFVTTHSPIICQAAEKGSIWRLPVPGSNEESGRVTGQELDRLVYGNVLEAYSTEYFGSDVSRSELSSKMVAELAELNIKGLRDCLSEEEEKRRSYLRDVLPSFASSLEG